MERCKRKGREECNKRGTFRGRKIERKREKERVRKRKRESERETEIYRDK